MQVYIDRRLPGGKADEDDEGEEEKEQGKGHSHRSLILHSHLTSSASFSPLTIRSVVA